MTLIEGQILELITVEGTTQKRKTNLDVVAGKGYASLSLSRRSRRLDAGARVRAVCSCVWWLGTHLIRARVIAPAFALGSMRVRRQL